MNATALRSKMVLAVALISTPVAAQTISGVAGMSFGNFIAGSGGTITIPPLGSRSQSGGVLLIGQGSTVSAAQFNVTGTANASYTITLPPNNTVALTDASSNSMALNWFLSNPASGQLLGGGSQTIHIGATLAVGNNQPPGIYSGSFNVTVNY